MAKLIAVEKWFELDKKEGMKLIDQMIPS